VLLRVALRVAFVGVILWLSRRYNFSKYVDTYLKRVNEFEVWRAALVFGSCAVVFSTLSPTGYLPTVLSGATFQLPVAIAVSYISANLGSAANLLLVRTVCQPMGARFLRSRGPRLETLNRLLRSNSVGTVVLLRLPYIGYGVLNYLFAASIIQPGPYLLGNLVGLIPGAILFTFLGQSARSLFQLIARGEFDPKPVGIVCAEIVLLVVSIGFIVRAVRRRERLREEERSEEGDGVALESIDPAAHTESDERQLLP